MKNVESHDEEVRKTLSSLDGIGGASPKPFFYTRLREKMERSTSGTLAMKWQWALAGSLLLIILNGGILYDFSQLRQETSEEVLVQMADEYATDPFSIYYPENIEDNDYK